LGGMSSPENMSVHDAQRGVHVPPEDVGAQLPEERASSGTTRCASAPQTLHGTPSGAGVRTRCSSVRPHSRQAYSNSGMR